MSDYEFKIGAYSPKTIPMARLAEYLAAFADLLGEKENVYFEKLKPGSTVVAVRVQSEARVRTRLRIQQVRTADKHHPTYKPYRHLNDMLRHDNADGSITAGGAEIIRFPGRKEAIPDVIGPFNKPTDIDGTLIRIGGRDKALVFATIEDPEGRFWTCDMDRNIARQLAPFIFGPPLRFSGTGRWQRTTEGKWELERFKIVAFKVIADSSLSETVAKIRGLSVKLDQVASR